MASADQTREASEPPVLVITGPTASGKSATALLLAEQLNGEIVSADSMQIYRGMDIGTAKATLAERRRIPHHLLDIRQPGDRFSVAEYKAAATTAIRGIYQKNRLPIVCGGTGQYLSALIEGLAFAETPVDLNLRAELNEYAEQKGPAGLMLLLQAADPETAARLAPTDRKRIIRALEVFQQTGLTLSQHNRQSRQAGPDFQFRCYALSHDRPILYERINQRVLQMITAGLADEVQALINLDLPANSTCLQAIGYKEMLPYLRGDTSLPDTINRIQQATRRYAKRQLTWFRRMPELHWLVNQDARNNAGIILENT